MQTQTTQEIRRNQKTDQIAFAAAAVENLLFRNRNQLLALCEPKALNGARCRKAPTRTALSLCVCVCVCVCGVCVCVCVCACVCVCVVCEPGFSQESQRLLCASRGRQQGSP